MNRPVTFATPRTRSVPRRGYTLIEILVATTLTLMLMGAVVEVFSMIGDSVKSSRSVLEMSGRMRATAERLQLDLSGVTVTMQPPRRPESNEGYFEVIEGPNVVPAVNIDDNNSPDTTVGDIDDILMFTSRSSKQPFIGRVGGGTIESDVAEVAWFLRGRTLYRRVLLVAPQVSIPATLAGARGYFAYNDISVRWNNTGVVATSGLVANTLGDLTKRECRFAHQSPNIQDWSDQTAYFPFHPHLGHDSSQNPPMVATDWRYLGLPTLRECSYFEDTNADPDHSWFAGLPLQQVGSSSQIERLAGVALLTQRLPARPLPDINFDAWANPHPWQETDQVTGTLTVSGATATPQPYLGNRIAEDVILTDVIGFDVKVWDPGAPILANGNVEPNPSASGIVTHGAYVDLGYRNIDYATWLFSPVLPLSVFAHWGEPRSGLTRVYDTGSSHYEHNGVNEDGVGGPDQGTDGFDNDNANGVDDPLEMETSPPYPAPLRGIQVKIRVFDPGSRQIREVTVEQDFLPK